MIFLSTLAEMGGNGGNEGHDGVFSSAFLSSLTTFALADSNLTSRARAKHSHMNRKKG